MSKRPRTPQLTIAERAARAASFTDYERAESDEKMVPIVLKTPLPYANEIETETMVPIVLKTPLPYANQIETETEE